MYKIPLLLILLLMPFGVFASSVDVIANPPSGTYHAPIYITLTPTQSGSKTFYSFKPDGYPQDAFLYEKPILLKHSSPFIYFSILSTTNESKIKQNDYSIEYPSTVHFDSDTISGSGKVEVMLVNSGSESVNIGYWYIQSESDTVTIPENTLLPPGVKYSISVNYLGTSSIVLRSPDDDERDILVPQGSPEKNEAILPMEKSVITKIVPRKIISTRETTPENVNLALKNTDIIEIPSSLGIVPTEEKATPTSSINKEVPKLDMNQIVKASTAESGQKSMNPLYLVALLALSLGIGIFQWYMKRRQK